MFGCSLHSLKVLSNNCLRKIYFFSTHISLSATAQRLLVAAPLTPSDLLALAIDPRTKYIFLGISGQEYPYWPKLLIGHSSTVTLLSVLIRFMPLNTRQSPPLSSQLLGFDSFFVWGYLFGGADGLLTSGFNSSTQKPGNSQPGLKMCADTAALSPAIKPFLDLLAQLPVLKPACQQRLFRLYC